jgi:hypothetical protein
MPLLVLNEISRREYYFLLYQEITLFTPIISGHSMMLQEIILQLPDLVFKSFVNCYKLPIIANILSCYCI